MIWIGYDTPMAFDLHPDAEKLHAGVRVNLLATERPRTSGGTQRREIAEVADAVVILPLLDDQRVVLIQNERFAVKQTLWELPAGTLEPGEDPAACAARELAEETGYEAQRVERLTSFYPSPGFCTEKLHAYRATGLRHVGQSLEETERITAHVMPIEEACAMVRDGRIEDGKTIAALLYHHALG